MKYLLPLFLLACTEPKQTFTFSCQQNAFNRTEHECVLYKETLTEIGVICQHEDWVTWLSKSDCIIMNEVDCSKFQCLPKVLE